ncbi:MAG: SGNH hydrolase domain-containing protein [Aeromicrobium erythreum]
MGQDVDAPDLAGCSYGDVDGDHELVLVGDSIAGSVFPAVEEAADRHGWRVRAWAKSSCTVADVTTHVKGSDQVWTACSRWRERVLAEIERRRPDLVVLAGSSGTFGLTMSPHGRVLGDGRERDQLVREGLLRTVERLRDGGTRVALVQSPHRARRLVPDCLAAEGDPAACSFTPRDETRHTDWVARQLPDLPYLRVADAACPGGRCRAVVGDTIVYRDKLHFTTRFARTLVPLVERAVAS